MILLPPELREQLRLNGLNPGLDHAPVLKLFNPVGAATWLVCEIESDGDTLFGLADLGFGCPELGSFSLAEMTGVRLPFGMSIERDILFEGAFPISVYAEAARLAGSITQSERLLRQASQSRGGR